MARKPKRDLTMEEQLARGPVDLPFLMILMLLVGIGLIMMFSASYASAYYDSSASVQNNPLYYIQRQGLFAAAGIVCMYIISKINYQILRPLSIPLLMVAIFLLVLVLTPLRSPRWRSSSSSPPGCPSGTRRKRSASPGAPPWGGS